MRRIVGMLLLLAMPVIHVLCPASTVAQAPRLTASRDLRIGSLDHPDYSLAYFAPI